MAVAGATAGRVKPEGSGMPAEAAHILLTDGMGLLAPSMLSMAAAFVPMQLVLALMVT